MNLKLTNLGCQYNAHPRFRYGRTLYSRYFSRRAIRFTAAPPVHKNLNHIDTKI